MRRIFIDLEMNPVSGEYADFRKQCRSEVIEIGAVIMDEQMHITDQFREYVKPEYNSVVLKKITRLTGISTETVSEAKSFQPVFLRFLAWCGAEDYEICSWSDNDIWQLMKELSPSLVTHLSAISSRTSPPDSMALSWMSSCIRDRISWISKIALLV